jgi:DNA-binding transcriptional LysR family regulator
VDIGLRHLRILLVVAEPGSISRAAIRLKIAQPGLTAQLKRIEQRLGGPLSQRRPDGVVPTELGAHVLGRSREILDESSDLLSTARALSRQAQPPGALGLGGVDSPWVPAIAAILRDRMPHHEQLTYLESSSQAVLELLYAEKIGLAVIIEFPDVVPPSLDKLSVRSLGTEPVLIGLSPQHRLAHRSVVKLEDLAEDTWIAPSEHADGLGLSLRVACARGLQPQVPLLRPGPVHRGGDRQCGPRGRRLPPARLPTAGARAETDGRRAALAPHVPALERGLTARRHRRGRARRGPRLPGAAVAPTATHRRYR